MMGLPRHLTRDTKNLVHCIRF